MPVNERSLTYSRMNVYHIKQMFVSFCISYHCLYYCRRISIMSHQSFSFLLYYDIAFNATIDDTTQTTKTSISFSLYKYDGVLSLPLSSNAIVHKSFGWMGGRSAVWVQLVGRLHWIFVYARITNELVALSRCFHANELQFYLLTHLQIIISPFLARSCVIHKFLHPTSSSCSMQSHFRSFICSDYIHL